MLNRFEWAKDVMQDASIGPTARLVACALALRFHNEKTGQTNPALHTLGTYLGASIPTIRRAVNELEASGWLCRTPGRGRGRKCNYGFRQPSGHPAQKALEKGVRIDTHSRREKVSNMNVKGVKSDHPHIMQEQSSEQSGRASAGRATPALYPVAAGSDHAGEWAEWLKARALPELGALPSLRQGDSFLLTSRRPPSWDQETAHRVAVAWIERAAAASQPDQAAGDA